MKERREQERRAPDNVDIDVNWYRLMEYDGIDTEDLPVAIDRDNGHIPQRRERRRMIVATSLYRHRERETLQFQLDLAHAHAELNG